MLLRSMNLPLHVNERHDICVRHNGERIDRYLVHNQESFFVLDPRE